VRYFAIVAQNIGLPLLHEVDEMPVLAVRHEFGTGLDFDVIHDCGELV
jgi:hypothetical protein